MLFETTYKYAGFEINAATDSEGNYWIAQKTINQFTNNERFQAVRFFKSKPAKALLGENYSLCKTSEKTNKQCQKQTFISVSDFLKACYILSEDNSKAKAIVFAGFTSDFLGTLKAHFGETMDEEQREYIRELVFLRIHNFKAWMDVVRDRHIKLFGEKPSSDYYRGAVKYVNMQLFGVSHFKNDRNNMTELQQTTITRFEEMLIAMSAKHSTACPKELIVRSLEVYKLVY